MFNLLICLAIAKECAYSCKYDSGEIVIATTMNKPVVEKQIDDIIIILKDLPKFNTRVTFKDGHAENAECRQLCE